MTRYLLDTNIFSNLVKPAPPAGLMAWMAERDDDELAISTLTLAEIQRGILELSPGVRRQKLQSWFEGPQGPPRLFAGRIHGFDAAAAAVWAHLMTEGRRRGRPRDALDMMVAAIASAHDCLLVTDNEKDFQGIPILNPLRH